MASFSNKQTKEVGKIVSQGREIQEEGREGSKGLRSQDKANFKYDREIFGEFTAEERRGQIHILKLFWHQETNIKLPITTLFILAEELEATQMPSKSRMDK